MTYVSSIEDLIDELDSLRSYGGTVSEAAYVAARAVDIRLFSSLDRRDAAMLVLRRASSVPVRKTTIR